MTLILMRGNPVFALNVRSADIMKSTRGGTFPEPPSQQGIGQKREFIVHYWFAKSNNVEGWLMSANDGASAVSSILALQWRITVLEEQAQIREHKLSLAVTYDAAKIARIKQLEAELEDWRKLREPGYLTSQLKQGIPARLSLQQLQHLQVMSELAAEGLSEGE